MSTFAIAQRAHPDLGPRPDLMDKAHDAVAERVGHLSLAHGRAVFQTWPAAAQAKGWLPIRLYLHRGSDDASNILGWGRQGEAQEVWFCAPDGTVERYDLAKLRAAMDARTLAKTPPVCPDMTHTNAHGRTCVTRFVPKTEAAKARIA